jgi:hypothetical protein
VLEKKKGGQKKEERKFERGVEGERNCGGRNAGVLNTVRVCVCACMHTHTNTYTRVLLVIAEFKTPRDGK